MGASEVDDYARELRAASERLGALNDPALCIDARLTGLLTRGKDRRGRSVRPAKVTTQFVAGGVEATLDDDELGYTWTVVVREESEIYPALAQCVHGLIGVMKRKSKSAAARKERAAQDAEIMAKARRIIEEDRISGS